MTTVLLDSHVVHWWSAEPDRLSRAAAEAVDGADELAVASISWFELAWLDGLSRQVRTIGTSPAIAVAAVSLPSSFPGDPADRLIYATAVEHGWSLVTKDERLRGHRSPRPITIW